MVESNAEINVTPFVDIMLVLLIIFMVSAPLATVSIRLDLPPPTPPKDATKPKDPTVISVQRDGKLFIDGPASEQNIETSPASIDADIATATGIADGRARRNEMIFIRAHQDVQYGDFMNAMNALQDTGYFKVGLIPEDIS